MPSSNTASQVPDGTEGPPTTQAAPKRSAHRGPCPLSWGEVRRTATWAEGFSGNCPDEHGPFDIIGDVHGCFDELRELLGELGYQVHPKSRGRSGPRFDVQPPGRRKAIFLGDIVDRGPKIPEVLGLVMDMADAGTALCVPGNHDSKLMRKLLGRDVQVAHGLEVTLAQLEKEPPEFVDRVRRFLESLPTHYVLDDCRLVVAHAGLKESLQGKNGRQVRSFALYGETTGEVDQFGLPVRLNWAARYHGKAIVVYGHTPVAEAEWQNRTINIDTGCVFSGKLTALRYPELELVSVPAQRVYWETPRPFLSAEVGAEASHAGHSGSHTRHPATRV